MIIIDGRASDLRIENFSNLEEILVEANAECTRAQRIVTDVLLNNEPFSEIYPHQAEDIERDEIRSVEINTMPLNEMALNITDELFKVTRMMESGSLQCAKLCRQGDDQQGLELFQDLLDVTRDFMSMIGVLRHDFVTVNEPEFDSLVEKVSALLGEMTEVLESEDWILLSDLLEFEFVPVSNAWNKILEKLRATISDTITRS